LKLTARREDRQITYFGIDDQDQDFFRIHTIILSVEAFWAELCGPIGGEHNTFGLEETLSIVVKVIGWRPGMNCLKVGKFECEWDLASPKASK
jgi:hypothetical protein